MLECSTGDQEVHVVGAQKGSVVECLTLSRGCEFEPHWRHFIMSLSII